MNDSLSLIFISTLLANNFVLATFLGLCPFLGVSSRLDTAFPMGVATTFVMLVASLCAYGLNVVLAYFHLDFLRLISYIVVIASSVQLVEMVMKKYTPALFQTARNYDLAQSLVFSFAGGAGFTLALVLMASLRERLQLANVPTLVQG